MVQKVALIAATTSSSLSPWMRNKASFALSTTTTRSSSNALSEGSIIGNGLNSIATSWFLGSTTKYDDDAASSTTTTSKRSHWIESRLLPGIQPLHLFRVVQDVDRYQDFLPLCSHSEVLRDSITNGGRSFSAEMVVGFGFGNGGGSPSSSMMGLFAPELLFRTKYFSEVTVNPEQLTIETRSGGGSDANDNDNGNTNGNHETMLFESLTSSWRLRPANEGSSSSSTSVDGTVVDFGVEMVVSDPVTAAVLDRVLGNVAETQVKAFRDRCLSLPPPTPSELEQAERFRPTNTATTATK